MSDLTKKGHFGEVQGISKNKGTSLSRSLSQSLDLENFCHSTSTAAIEFNRRSLTVYHTECPRLCTMWQLKLVR